MKLFHRTASKLTCLKICLTLLLLSCSLYIVSVSHLFVGNENPKLEIKGRSNDPQELYMNNSTVNDRVRHNHIVLVWNPLSPMSSPIEAKPFSERCAFSNCLITTNRSFLEDSSAIIFEAWPLKSRKVPDIPSTRNREQLWIARTAEAPARFKPLLSEYDNIFNLTITYSRASDIALPYAKVRSLKGKKRRSKFHFQTDFNKTKIAAWMVSNCKTPSKRIFYVRELQKHVNVDIYGKCGPLSCGRKKRDFGCYKMIEKNYKFYLSFENSICEDYITEKVWNILKLDIVPVVLGGADYASLLPPHSYIDVANFTSPKALAAYLKQVANDDDLYRSYFRWKREYFIASSRLDATCSLCKVLNDPRDKTRTIASFNEFWSSKKHCRTAKEYFSVFMNTTPKWV